jgi:hypothetical protein
MRALSCAVLVVLSALCTGCPAAQPGPLDAGGGAGGGGGGAGGGTGGGSGGGAAGDAGVDPNARNENLPRTFSVTGAVERLTFSGPEVVEGASVTLSVDRGRDGTVDATASATSDAAGAFAAAVAIEPGDLVVIGIEYDGHAPFFQTVHAEPAGTTHVRATLHPLVRASCDTGACRPLDDSFRVRDLPQDVAEVTGVRLAGSRGLAALPGGTMDLAGNLLLPAVVAAVELKDGAGQPVTTLATPATLCLELPRESWAQVSDGTSGDGKLTVPLYAFDEVRGAWVAEGSAELQDTNGAALAEAVLPAIRGRSHAERVLACGQVSHFSFWSVMFRAAAQACVVGRLIQSGAPLSGAVLGLLAGSSELKLEGFTTDDFGRFRLPVLPSERAAEDFDLDGQLGESRALRLTMMSSVAFFVLTALTLDLAPASGGACQELGDLLVDDTRKLEPARCAVTGVVVDRVGTPLAGASISAWDPSARVAQGNPLCDFTCVDGAVSDANGQFSLDFVVRDGLAMKGEWSYSEPNVKGHVRSGVTFFGACPTKPVQLVLEEGFSTLTVQASLVGDTFSWLPNLPMRWFHAALLNQGPFWSFYAPPVATPFSGPITWGTDAPGTVRTAPTPPFAVGSTCLSGALIQVNGDWVDEAGYYASTYGAAGCP